MKLNLSAVRRGAKSVRALAATAVLVAPGAVADDTPGPQELAPGVSTQTVWDASTPLVDANGEQASGLQAGNRVGVSSIKFSERGDVLVGEKGGRLVYFPSERSKRGTVLTTRSGEDLSADTLASVDTGMGGIAFDPQWPRRPYVYALYSSNDRMAPQGTGKWANAPCEAPRT